MEKLQIARCKDDLLKAVVDHGFAHRSQLHCTQVGVLPCNRDAGPRSSTEAGPVSEQNAVAIEEYPHNRSVEVFT